MHLAKAAWGVIVLLVSIASVTAFAQGRGAPPQGRGGPTAPPTGRAAAPVDLTGQWVSLITEDWRYRMFTPPKGDYALVPLNARAKVARRGIPAKDEAAGEQCKAYGAAGIMRMPTRLRISWQDDTH